MDCKFWSSHSGAAELSTLLGCYALSTSKKLTPTPSQSQPLRPKNRRLLSKLQILC